MKHATTLVPSNSCLTHLHTVFLADVLPRVLAHGRVYFRNVKCHHTKEELLAEMRALCWKWYVSLIRRGKNVLAFVSVLATYAARAVHSGRRVCGHEKAKDVLSPVAQRLHGFAVGKLPDFSTLDGSPLEEALIDNTVSPVPEQVAFRIDFPAWRLTHWERDRRLIDTLMLGERTKDVSRLFGLSQGRVSQKRRQFLEDWRRFCGEPVEVCP
jgi:hypothetical protein